MKTRIIIFVYFLCVLSSCGFDAGKAVESDAAPVISPDYSAITIPVNIAPLDFRISDEAESYCTVISGASGKEITVRGRSVLIPVRKWRKLLSANAGGTVFIRVYEKKDGEWHAMEPVRNRIAEEPVDEYIAYRLIEPTYGMAGQMSITQRRLSDFREKDIFNNNLDVGARAGQCINCHSFQNHNPEKMQFHVRQKDGGTIFVEKGNIRKVNLGREGFLGPGVYPSWHPTLNILAYSMNVTNQYFFSQGPAKTEVVDSYSDVVLYDVEKDEVLPVATDPDMLETFPYWSADGSCLYYACASMEGISHDGADKISDDYDKIHYNIVKAEFNPSNRSFGEAEVIFNADTLGMSATFPRPSPDGRYLLFTLGQFGNFHIWHKEADLYLMDLYDRSVCKLENVNSDDTESYHSWSSNGRWIVFSSRRDDGVHTRLYIAYFDESGRAFKPFVLPQKDPCRYDRLFKSYNIPEFIVEEVGHGPKDFVKAVRKTK